MWENFDLWTRKSLEYCKQNLVGRICLKMKNKRNMGSGSSDHKRLEENTNSSLTLDSEVVVAWQNIWLNFAHILGTWEMLSLKKIVCICLLPMALRKNTIRVNLGRTGLIWLTDPDYSPTLREPKEGTQAGQKPKVRKWSKDHGEMLLIGWLLRLAQIALFYYLWPPAQAA